MQAESQTNARESLGTAQHRIGDPHRRHEYFGWRMVKQLRRHQGLESLMELLFIVKRLRSSGFKTTIRYSLGPDIAAACGQLVRHENRQIAKAAAISPVG